MKRYCSETPVGTSTHSTMAVVHSSLFPLRLIGGAASVLSACDSVCRLFDIRIKTEQFVCEKLLKMLESQPDKMSRTEGKKVFV